jgi:16S rRNA (uracil1498-N3)-methyltransferase
MRALYLKNLLNLETCCSIEGESFHHLKNVLRIKMGEEILLIDGKGNFRLAKIDEISKKSINLAFIKEAKFQQKKYDFYAALAQTKKESLELSLKQLVEIGVSKIYIYTSEYSDRKELNDNRLNKLLISALEQSNAKYLPMIEKVSFEQLLKLDVEKLIYFTSIEEKEPFEINSLNKCMVVIGPEGGLSLKEEDKIRALKDSIIINLPTNILRASTATATCCGYLLGKLDF